jgi:hypothetical protein
VTGSLSELCLGHTTQQPHTTTTTTPPPRCLPPPPRYPPPPRSCVSRRVAAAVLRVTPNFPTVTHALRAQQVPGVVVSQVSALLPGQADRLKHQGGTGFPGLKISDFPPTLHSLLDELDDSCVVTHQHAARVGLDALFTHRLLAVSEATESWTSRSSPTCAPCTWT